MSDWLKNLYSVINSPYKDVLLRRPKQVNDELEIYKNNKIVSIMICRSPIKSVFMFLLNILTLGELKKEMKKYSYDKMFHLYMLIKLENNEILLAERNQRVLLKPVKNNDIEMKECIKIDIKNNLTLNELFINAEHNDIYLYRYDSVKHNCQNFIKTLLVSSEIIKYNDDIIKFISQDATNLFNKYHKQIMNMITDTANIAENIYKGGEI